MENFCWSWINFQAFNITSFSNFSFIKLAIFLCFLKFCHFLGFLASRATELPLGLNNMLLYVTAQFIDVMECSSSF